MIDRIFGICIKLRYSILSICQVILLLFNSAMLIKIFSVSIESDSIYLSTLIISSLGLLSSSFTQQFLYFYQDLIVESKDKANLFYDFVISITFFSQIIFTLVIFLFIRKIIFIFTGNINFASSELVKNITLISLIQFFFIPFSQINSFILNANNLLFKAMLIQIIPISIISFTYLYMFFSSSKNILLIPFTTSITAIFTFIIQIFIISKNRAKIRFTLKHELSKNFILNSVSMKIGHNIHNLLTQLIITNVLSSLPQGIATSYSYGDKISNILKSILIFPYFTILQTNLSKYFSQKNNTNLYNEIRLFLFKVIPIHLLSIILTSFIIYFMRFNIIYFIQKITLTNIYNIIILFLLISIWNLVIEIEAPYVQIIVSDKKSFAFIIINSIFIIFVYILYSSFFNKDIFGMMYSFIISQVLNSILYTSYAIFILKKRLIQ